MPVVVVKHYSHCFLPDVPSNNESVLCLQGVAMCFMKTLRHFRPLTVSVSLN
eukprot:m.113056 g.113056  ORF g.113056 m.113056 type:complete len:52 (-) comp12795_c0_seq28:75-230(-)